MSMQSPAFLHLKCWMSTDKDIFFFAVINMIFIFFSSSIYIKQFFFLLHFFNDKGSLLLSQVQCIVFGGYEGKQNCPVYRMLDQEFLHLSFDIAPILLCNIDLLIQYIWYFPGVWNMLWHSWSLSPSSAARLLWWLQSAFKILGYKLSRGITSCWNKSLVIMANCAHASGEENWPSSFNLGSSFSKALD